MTRLTLQNAWLLAGTMALTGCLETGGGSASDPANTPVTPETEVVNPTVEPPTVEPAPPVGPQLGDANVCTTEGINHWVDAQMRDYYLYYDQVPLVNPSDYADADDLMDDLRVHPDIYSGIRSAAQNTAFFEEGQTFDFGVRFNRVSEFDLRIGRVIARSPADVAGIQRGDSVTHLNGYALADLTNEIVTPMFGEQGVPTTIDFSLVRDGQAFRISVTSGLFEVASVSSIKFFDTTDGTRIGYIESSFFISATEADLDFALTRLIELNIDELILDYRYNGGGYVYVAQKFAAQLLGSAFTGETLLTTTFNDKYSENDYSLVAEPQSINASMPRVVILTTGNTASAAEMMANSMSPFIDVVLIGEETNGKPFISAANENCGLALNAMHGITANKAGVNVLGGLTPTCSVEDATYYPMDDPRDAILNAGLQYIIDGSCPTTIAAAESAADRAARYEVDFEKIFEDRIPGGMF